MGISLAFSAAGVYEVKACLGYGLVIGSRLIEYYNIGLMSIFSTLLVVEIV